MRLLAQIDICFAKRGVPILKKLVAREGTHFEQGRAWRKPKLGRGNLSEAQCLQVLHEYLLGREKAHNSF